MKVFRVTVMIVDHDGIGEAGIRAVLENARYSNRCITPRVASVEDREIEWDDKHPINQRDSARWLPEFEALFVLKAPCTHLTSYLCMHCREPRCMDCHAPTVTEYIKTAIRWCNADACIEDEAKVNGLPLDAWRELRKRTRG